MDIKTAIEKRNESWENKKEIPKWVQLENVSLDQFFTEPKIAKIYYDKMVEFLNKKEIKIDDCLFIEPSAGSGEFFKLLPPSNRIGLDLYPMHEEIIQTDFLDWTPPTTNKKIIFIGNPPFGYRAWLALTFMNHVAKYADYAFFILPMSFQSEGKGSPKNRVNGMKLLFSEYVPKDSFYEPSGKKCKINALWQIWEKGENTREKFDTCEEFIDLFTVDQRKERLCGQEKMKEANFFFQRTYYNQQPSLVKDFSEVKYVCGYGMIIKKDREKIINILNSTDWDKYSNLAAHNCRHISMYHINKALLDGGL